MNCCILSFSGRPDGNCAAIAKEIQRQLPGGWDVESFDFSTFTITPCGHCGYQCFQGRENCPYFSDPECAICDAVANSDIAYFIVPNYSDFPCANFFIFNERSLCYFMGRGDLLEKYSAARKKFVVVSSSETENFAAAFRYHAKEPEILFLSAHAFHKDSVKGDLMDSPEAREALAGFIQA